MVRIMSGGWRVTSACWESSLLNTTPEPDHGADNLSKEYLETARTLFRFARSMANQEVADRLKALAEDYERRAEQALESLTAQSQLRRPALPGLSEK